MNIKSLLLVACSFLASCASVSYTNVRTQEGALTAQYDSLRLLADSYPEKVEIRYAKGLKVNYLPDGIHILISNPDPKAKATAPQELVLPMAPLLVSPTGESKDTPAPVPGSAPVPEASASGKGKFICTTALQLGNFEVLGLEDRIVGINSLKNIFSERILTQLSDGRTKRLGKEGNFDVESVIALHPDYIFVSASKYGGFEALKDCGIPLVLHHGYKETNPLGQAEWIKLIGLLTGETRRANAVFDHIEREYHALCKLVTDYLSSPEGKAKGRPTVLSGRQLRDGWYVMGGKSYMAQLFHDAGAQYIMDDINDTGGVTLDFETVYARGINADFWQVDGSFDTAFTLDDLIIEDPRYGDIAAHKNKKVIFCNLTMTPYRELAGVAPHIMLADFIRAFHPNLLPDHKPKFYDFLQ